MTLPTLVVEVGFTTGASTSNYLHLNDVVRGVLDIGTWGPTDLWVDVAPYVRRIRTERLGNRGENRGPVWRYDGGRAVIELNDPDRRFDPTNLAGPYVAAGRTQVTPMRTVRIMARYGGLTYPIFRGFADSWLTTYDEEANAIVTLTATDATKVLSAYDRGAGSAVGAGENSGARVSRILNSAGWSATDRKIATGNATLQATTLAGSAWDELLLVADTEVGEIYVDESGRVVFRNRQGLMEDLRSINAQALFGDQPVITVAPPTPHPTPTTVNLATNPSAEVNTDGWGGGGTVPPTITQSSAQAKFGTKSVLATWGTDGVLPLVGYDVIGLEMGLTYTWSVYVYVPTGSPAVFQFLGGIASFWDGLGELSTVNDQWQRLVKTHTVTPETGTTWNLQIWPNSVPTAGQQVYIDGLQVEEGEVATPYVDGDQTPPPSTLMEWDYLTAGPSTTPRSTSRRLPELPYAEIAQEYDGTTVANYIRITRVGGAEQNAQDPASQDEFLIHVHNRTDLIMQDDTAAKDYARFALYQARNPELRFSAIEIRPLRDGVNLFPQALGRKFGDRIRIIRRPPGGGTITRECFIRGIVHDFDGEQWITQWQLQSATKWAFLILDHATLGRLDENAWGY